MAIYWRIALGVGAAVVRVIYGYASERKKAQENNEEPEPISLTKVLWTLVCGVISGALIGAFFQGSVQELVLGIFLGTVTLDDLAARLTALHK